MSSKWDGSVFRLVHEGEQKIMLKLKKVRKNYHTRTAKIFLHIKKISETFGTGDTCQTVKMRETPVPDGLGR